MEETFMTPTEELHEFLLTLRSQLIELPFGWLLCQHSEEETLALSLALPVLIDGNELDMTNLKIDEVGLAGFRKALKDAGSTLVRYEPDLLKRTLMGSTMPAEDVAYFSPNAIDWTEISLCIPGDDVNHSARMTVMRHVHNLQAITKRLQECYDEISRVLEAMSGGTFNYRKHRQLSSAVAYARGIIESFTSKETAVVQELIELEQRVKDASARYADKVVRGTSNA